MTDNRVIWRPNEIAPEAWEALGRDAQIAWWRERDRAAASKPRPDPLQAVVGQYRRGVLTPHAFAGIVFDALTDTNVRAFVTGCPDDLLAVLRDVARGLPRDDDEPGWGRLIAIEGGCYAPWVTAEEIERGRRESRARFREGIRTFRAADGS